MVHSPHEEAARGSTILSTTDAIRGMSLERVVEQTPAAVVILETITDAFAAVDAEWRYTYLNQRAMNRIRRARGEDLSIEDFLGVSCWELYPQLVGTAFYHELQRAAREQKSVAFETYSPASELWLNVTAYPSKDGGLSVFSQDITERRLGEQARDRSAHQQALVADLGVRALASDDLTTLIDDAVGLVALSLDVELVGIAESLSDREALLLRAGVGWNAGVVGEATALAGPGSLLNYTIASGETVVSEDFAADERFEISTLLSEHGVVSGATVLISGRDEAFGSLGAFSRRHQSLSEDDANFMRAVANVLATAVERTQSSRKLREVRDTERRRLARALHDEGLQELTQALSLARELDAGSSDPGATSALVPALKRVGQQMRGAIHNLRLEEDENRPFPERLEALVALHRAMAIDCDIELDVPHEDPGDPLGQAGTELLRIVGEALTNARRHARAASIRVAAGWSETELFVEVTDDGRGFNPEALFGGPGGTGIAGMRERAHLVRADLRISSEPHAGTAVRVRLPFAKADKPVAQVRVLLVEDHAAVREAIAAMFERDADFEVCRQAASLAEARAMLEGIDVAVVDLRLPDGYGGDLIAELLAVNRHAQALVLSATLDRADLALAIESGAAGALEKTAHLDEVVDAVRRLRAGETLMPVDEALELLRFAETRREQERADRAAIEQLTPREREVLQALAQGLDSQAIAECLHITLRTERNHVANILGKLGVHSQLQALVFALRYELVEVSQPPGRAPRPVRSGDRG
ncbi:MAG TPA: LuxR C-terminal-related transcriptional regulator [Solirubrobacteraceae bacterium]|nr:LuxR C-terminal-related transcriptional regulator [Solirubrobacteraceae bacterium]